MATNEENLDAARALLAEALQRNMLAELGHISDGWIDRAFAVLKRTGWKVSYLKELGTVAFDMDLMLQLVHLDESGALQFGRWLAVVPDCYRAIAEKGIPWAVEGHIGRPFTEERRLQIVYSLSGYCRTRASDQRHSVPQQLSAP